MPLFAYSPPHLPLNQLGTSMGYIVEKSQDENIVSYDRKNEMVFGLNWIQFEN